MIDHKERCSLVGCDFTNPLDMASIIIDDRWFCSPDCALEELKNCSDLPDLLVLYDPQYRLRDTFHRPPDGDRYLEIDADSVDEAITKVESVKELSDHPFRMDPDGVLSGK